MPCQAKLATLAVAAMTTLAACPGKTDPPTVAPKVDASHQDPPTSDAPAASPPAVVIPVSAVDPAPWFEPPERAVVDPLTLDQFDDSVATGDGFAVVSTVVGPIAVHATEGVQGRVVAPKETEAFGMDDAGLIALAKGALWRAGDWRKRDGWTVLPTPSTVATFDATAGHIVAMSQDGQRLLRSTDQGRTFNASPSPLVGASAIFVRPDGLVVVQGLDPAGRLQTRVQRRPRSPWQTAQVPRLRRVAGYIETDRYNPQVLAADGERWVAACHDYGDYSNWTTTTGRARSGAEPSSTSMPDLRHPRPPTGEVECDGMMGWGGLGMGVGPEPIRGTTGPAPAPSRHSAAFFADGRCRPDPEYIQECDDNVPLLRRPHAFWLDGVKRDFSLLELPVRCGDARIENAAGLALLLCSTADATTLYTTTGQRWVRETTLPTASAELSSLTAAPDGTLLLHGDCRYERPCTPSALRRPTALGAKSAWLELADPDVLAYRVLDGGRALAIGGTQHGYDLTVLDGTQGHALAAVSVDDYALVGLQIDWRDRSVGLAFRPVHLQGPDGAKAPRPAVQRFVLGPDGALSPSPLHRLDLVPRETTQHVIEVAEGDTFVGIVNDVNGDGIDELVARRFAPPRFSVIFGSDALATRDLTDAAETGHGVNLPLSDTGHSPAKVASAGDIDGDGLGDLIVTTARWGNLSDLSAYVVFGRRTIGRLELASIDRGQGGFAIRGAPAGDDSSHTVAGVGDLDGDGLDDVALGLRAANNGRGRIYVVYGKKNGEWVHLGDVERGIGGFVLESNADRARLWQAIAGIGDLDGDGKDELVLGSPERLSKRGSVYIVRGAERRRAGPRTIESLVAQGAARRLDGSAEGERFGGHLFAESDFDGDGLRDLLASATGSSASDDGAGRVYALPGAKLMGGSTPRRLASELQGLVIEGAYLGDRLGSTLGSIPGAKRDRIVVGVDAASRFGREHGLVYLVPGRTGGAAVQLGPDQAPLLKLHAGADSVSVLRGTGDVNGDGRADLVMTVHSPQVAAPTLVVATPP